MAEQLVEIIEKEVQPPEKSQTPKFSFRRKKKSRAPLTAPPNVVRTPGRAQKKQSNYYKMYDTIHKSDNYYREKKWIHEQQNLARRSTGRVDPEELEALRSGKKKSKAGKHRGKKTDLIIVRAKEVILNFDKFWIDLFENVISHLQLLALLWATPIRLPLILTKTSFLIKLFNFDFLSWRNEQGGIGQAEQMSFSSPFVVFPYLFLWILFSYSVTIFWYFFVMKMKTKNRFVFEKLLFYLVRFLYIPTIINVLVHGGCYTWGGSMNVCFCGGDKICWIISMILLVFGLGYAFMVPIMIYVQAKKLIVCKLDQKHENYIRNLEIEASLRISNNFVYTRAHLINSFTRTGIFYYYISRHAQVFLIAVAWMAIPFDPTGENRFSNMFTAEMLLTLVLCGLVFLPLIGELILRPFRLYSRLLVSQIFGWTLVINMVLSLLKAFELRNAFLVDNTLFMLIVLVNVVALVLVFFFFLIFLVLRIRWPINSKIAQDLEDKFSHYLTAVRDGLLLYEHAISTTPSFVRCDLMLRHKNYLESLYRECLLNNNPLLDTFENIILKLDEEYYANEAISLLPQRRLQDSVGKLRKVMDKREEEMVLLHERARILLLKVVAYNGLRKLAGKKSLVEDLKLETTAVEEIKEEKIDLDSDDVEEKKQKIEEEKFD